MTTPAPPIKQIRTEQDYAEALARVGEIMTAKPGSPEYDELEVRSILISEYEATLADFSTPDPDPTKSLKDRLFEAADQVDGLNTNAASLMRDAATILADVPNSQDARDRLNIEEFEGARARAGWNSLEITPRGWLLRRSGHDRIGVVEPGTWTARGYGCICMPSRVVNAQVLPFEIVAECPVHPDHRWVAMVHRDRRQSLIATWAKASFGEAEATSIAQRGIRLLEEAVELYQACDGNEEMAHKLVSYVFGRPKGEIGQELGGVAICALLTAEAAGVLADEEEAREVARILSKPTKHFAERNANKNAAGFKADQPGEPGDDRKQRIPAVEMVAYPRDPTRMDAIVAVGPGPHGLEPPSSLPTAPAPAPKQFKSGKDAMAWARGEDVLDELIDKLKNKPDAVEPAATIPQSLVDAMLEPED